ncbi:MAG TPA: hypothetical protein PK048_02345 [Candidatus Absconditabacterales bacterium]|nr:hypothetical protein [Candidatus Absconditabacterales bacterium]
MKNFLNVLGSVIVALGLLVVLNKTGIITFTQSGGGSIEKSNIIDEGQRPDQLSGIFDSFDPQDDTMSTGKQEQNTVINNNEKQEHGSIKYPYDGSGAQVGTFVLLGTTSNGQSVYVYRVKLGGVVGGVEDKRVDFVSGTDLSSGFVSSATYVTATGVVHKSNDTLTKDQLVFVEVKNQTITTKELINSSTSASSESISSESGSNKQGITITCNDYFALFSCVIDKTSIDSSLLKKQFSDIQKALKSLTISEQQEKCTILYNQMKTSLEYNNNTSCLK